jgi:hypothetical protein
MKTYLQNLENVIRNINLPFQVMEDNGGGLYLVVFDEDREIIFLSGEYEYEHTILTNALISISNKTIDEAKSIVNSWKTNVNDFNNDRSNLNYASIYEKLTTDKIGIFTIVDNQGVYPALMGNAGAIEFKILENLESEGN